jgi:hypothetical protein
MQDDHRCELSQIWNTKPYLMNRSDGQRAILGKTQEQLEAKQQTIRRMVEHDLQILREHPMNPQHLHSSESLFNQIYHMSGGRH